MPPLPVRPTPAELQILGVLWQHDGPLTVRDVHQHLGRGGRDAGYTTVLKLMQIMHDKGLVRRERRGRSHVYRPAAPPEQTQRRIVKELLERAFGGSVRKLMVAALSARRATPQELREIQQLLAEAEKNR